MFWRLLVYVLVWALGLFFLGLAILPFFETTALAFYGEVERFSMSGKGRLVYFLSGLTLLAIASLIFMRWLKAFRYAREVSYQTEHGRVSVSLLAIEEALTRAVERETGVRKVSIKVFEDRVKRCIVIESTMSLWEGQNVQMINRRCQEILHQRFSELMPEKTQVQILLSVHRLKKRPQDRWERGDMTTQDNFQDDDRRLTRQTETNDEAQVTEAERVGTDELKRLQSPSGIYRAAQLDNLQQANESALASEQVQRVIEDNSANDRAETIPDEDDKKEDEQFDDLYFGPHYPVSIDEQDFTGSALPADNPDENVDEQTETDSASKQGNN